MPAFLPLAASLIILPGPPCFAGPAEARPPGVTQLRPLPTARCAYDLAEAKHRIGRLLALAEGRLNREAVERIFSTPQLTTSFDDPRSANYDLQIEGAGWRLRISFNETFYPSNGPAEFTRELRPRRLHPRRRGEARLWVLLSDASGRALPAPSCLNGQGIVARLHRLGWREAPPAFATDVGLVHGGFRRGRRLALSADGMQLGHPAPACVSSFWLTRNQS